MALNEGEAKSQQEVCQDWAYQTHLIMMRIGHNNSATNLHACVDMGALRGIKKRSITLTIRIDDVIL